MYYLDDLGEVARFLERMLSLVDPEADDKTS
jgi:hypothetical protein